MERILVAGGAGFIGSHLCKKLLSQNFEVICIDNFLTGNKKNIEALLSNASFTLIEHDISEQISNFQFPISNFQYIFHLASPASPNRKSSRSYINLPIETLLVNSVGTYNLLELARKSGAKFLYASSSEIYGDPTVSPQHEDYFGNVSPNGIRSVYDEGKRFGEALTMAFVRREGIDGRIVRIFNTYGPSMAPDDGRVVSNFITQALAGQALTVYGDGSQTRSFCYVDDMVEGLIKAMFTDNTKGEVINLGNPDERSVSDLAALVKKMAESTSDITFEELPEDDPTRRKPDTTKAKTLLSWEPKIAIEEGLVKTIQYFKEEI